MRTEIRISGYGGQGIISAGKMLADSAVRCGLFVTQSQSYGPEARGGSSKAEVVISDKEIDYPKAVSPQFSLCLTREAYESYGINAPETTEVYVDAKMELEPDSRAVPVPIIEAAESISPRSANVVAVAFISRLTGLVSEESLKASLKEQFPKLYETNLKCAEAGFEIAKKLKP